MREERYAARVAEIALASAGDDRYAPATTTALLSAALRMQGSPPCIFIDCGLHPTTRSHVEATFERYGVPLTWQQVDIIAYRELPVEAHLRAETFARLALPEFAQKLAQRTLYLDADTLTLSSIESLISFPLHDCVVGAVTDQAIPTVSSPSGILGWERLGLPPALGFFNAGVLLIDNRRWTEARVSSRAFALLRDYPEEATYADQGALNAAVRGFWMPLDRKWNFRVPRSLAFRAGQSVFTRRLSVPVADLGILHFAGTAKPWDPSYPPGAFRRWYAAEYARCAPFAQTPRYWPVLRWAAARP